MPRKADDGLQHAEELPDFQKASRQELQNTLEKLATANRRLALLNLVSTRLMEEGQPSFSDLFERMTQEIGAQIFIYQKVDSIWPDILHVAAASEQHSEAAAARVNDMLSAVVRLARVNEQISLEALDVRSDRETEPFRILGLRSFMRVPLLAGEQLLGAVSFGSATQSAFQREDQDLVRTFADQLAAALERQRLVAQLRESEQLYRGAVITGRLASWETNMVTRERIWTKEGLEMFGLDLPNGRGIVGGDNDEFRRTLHPEDRHKVAEFHRTADEIDSYPAEYRIIRSDGRLMWMSGRGRVIERAADGKARRVANIVVDVTERKKSEERTKLLIDELNHRVKNTLSTVQAIIAQALRPGSEPRDARKIVESRLQSLSRSHDLLTRENWDGADFHEVIEQALRPFLRPSDGQQIAIDGPTLRLRPKVAVSMGMALHELATNASKYGALTVETGRIMIAWREISQSGKSFVDFSWTESRGPPVRPRLHKGFGSRLIEQGLAHELRGEARIAFPASGVQCTIVIPSSVIKGSAE